MNLLLSLLERIDNKQYTIEQFFLGLRERLRQAAQRRRDRRIHARFLTDSKHRIAIMHTGDYVIYSETRSWCTGIREECPCGERCCACRHMERHLEPYVQEHIDHMNTASGPLVRRWLRDQVNSPQKKRAKVQS